jgi:hypothetical protein
MSVEKAPANSTVGEVKSAGFTGDKVYSYVVSSRDDRACPNQVPLGTKNATTVALVRQASSSCTNADIASAEPAVLVGSVTVYRASSRSKGVNVHLVSGASPGAKYGVFIKCGEKLGTLEADASGHADRTFNFRTDDLGPEFAFEIVPEGGAEGAKIQSVKVAK